MSLDPPAYILSLQNNIRARPISWEGAVRAKTITDADLQKIKAIDKVRKEQRKQVIEKDPDSYVDLFLGSGKEQSIFQAAGKRPDIVQYMLVLAGDLIDGMCKAWGATYLASACCLHTKAHVIQIYHLSSRL
jgi:V-type H+-transporting ATPase subunit H